MSDIGSGPPAGGEIGSVLADRYRIDEVIGRGGMSTVYRATDEALGRTVALKVFRADLADADDVRRQQDEIRLIAGLNHVALVTLFDAVSTDSSGDDSSGSRDRTFIVMQYVDGRDLRDRLSAGPIDATTVAMLGADLAEALAYVHGRGVVHRDVKPGNILLPNHGNSTTGPQAMLADFGIARIVDGTRHTATGSVLGTASYLSPEQAVGSAMSSATDVYSLGLVLIECLTGERCFPGSGLESVSARLSRDPEVPDRFGFAWEELLRAMTAREPAARIDAAGTAAALRRIALAPVEVPDPTLRYPVATLESTEVLSAPVNTAGITERLVPAKTDLVPPAAELVVNVPRKHGVRSMIAIVTIIVALLVAAAIAWWAVTSTPPAPDFAPVNYPTVDGDLGRHLEQLQRSVEP